MEKITGTPPTDEEFADMLTEAEEWLGYGERSNWPAAFRGFVRDFYATHSTYSPSRPSQSFEEFPAEDSTAPVADETPAPVIDAEIVEDHTEEESTMTPLSFRALFTEDPRPSAARCLSALSKLQKAGITDEEIHRAHKAGRMDAHPNPDDCAERIISDRDTTAAGCPF